MEQDVKTYERNWPSRDQARSKVETRIRPIVRGLVRCGGQAMEVAVASWKEALARDVRKAVRVVRRLCRRPIQVN